MFNSINQSITRPPTETSPPPIAPARPLSSLQGVNSDTFSRMAISKLNLYQQDKLRRDNATKSGRDWLRRGHSWTDRAAQWDRLLRTSVLPPPKRAWRRPQGPGSGSGAKVAPGDWNIYDFDASQVEEPVLLLRKKRLLEGQAANRGKYNGPYFALKRWWPYVNRTAARELEMAAALYQAMIKKASVCDAEYAATPAVCTPLYQRAHDLRPDLPDPLERLASLYLHAGEYAQCHRYASRLARLPAPVRFATWGERCLFKQEYPGLAMRCAAGAGHWEAAAMYAGRWWRGGVYHTTLTNDTRVEKESREVVVRAYQHVVEHKLPSPPPHIAYMDQEYACDDLLGLGKELYKHNETYEYIKPVMLAAFHFCPHRIAPYFELSFMTRKVKNWTEAHYYGSRAFAMFYPKMGYKVKYEQFLYMFRLPVTVSMICYNMKLSRLGWLTVERIGTYRALTANTLHSMRVFGHKITPETFQYKHTLVS